MEKFRKGFMVFFAVLLVLSILKFVYFEFFFANLHAFH